MSLQSLLVFPRTGKVLASKKPLSSVLPEKKKKYFLQICSVIEVLRGQSHKRIVGRKKIWKKKSGTEMCTYDFL